jgi:tetratricopeptide (TPR) repeat protein
MSKMENPQNSYNTSKLDGILDALKKNENTNLEDKNCIKALEDFNKALELNPNYNVVYKNKAITYFYMGDFDNAITNYEFWERNDKKAYDKINKYEMLNYAMLLYYKNPKSNLVKQILEKLKQYHLLMEIACKENNHNDVIKYSTMIIEETSA